MWTLAFEHHEDRTPTRLRYKPGGRDDGIRQELAAGMSKKRRAYQPRIVSGQVMMPADLKRLHKYMLEIEGTRVLPDAARHSNRRPR